MDACSAVDATLRLVGMYMVKSEERNLPETREDMHAEILNDLGNAWFALLPSMSKVSQYCSTNNGCAAVLAMVLIWRI